MPQGKGIKALYCLIPSRPLNGTMASSSVSSQPSVFTAEIEGQVVGKRHDFVKTVKVLNTLVVLDVIETILVKSF